MTQSLKLAFEVLQMPINELSTWLEKEIYANPLLELTQPPDFQTYHFEQSTAETLKSFLNKEIAVLFTRQKDYLLAHQLCDYIDNKGFLISSYAEIAENIGTTTEKIHELADAISQLDPPGIATINMQHALLAQLVKLKKVHSLGYEIIDKCWDALNQLDFDAICKKIKISKHQLHAVIESEIRPLNPFPAACFEQIVVQTIEPDLIIFQEGEKLQLQTKKDRLPQFEIQYAYLENKENQEFFRKYLTSAKWLNRIIKRRNTVLEEIGLLLIKYESAYFFGLRNSPTLLSTKLIAETLNVSLSTVSRALSHKYVETPRGIFPLTHFTKVIKLNENFHSQEIHEAILSLINSEDKSAPLSDQRLAQLLLKQGIKVSRRTVAKYRTELKIPALYARKK